MSTTSKKEEKKEFSEWAQWGKDGTPEMSKLIKLLLEHTNARKNILEETKKWLLQNGKSKH